MSAQTAVLVLDVDFQRLRITTWRKIAKKLAVPGKVEVVEYSRDRTIRVVNEESPMPSVVRVLRRFNRNRQMIKFSRLNIYTRDGFVCQYCRHQFVTEDLTFDHVIPRSQKGRTCWENIVTCCIPCNSTKANRTPAEAGMKLLRQPKKPHFLPSVMVDMDYRHIPPEWGPYWSGTLEP